MDQKKARKLEQELVKAIVEIVCRLGLRRLPLLPSLTREPLPLVAAKTGLSLDCLCAYEALFFSVREHLDATDWIAAQVIGPGLQRGFAPEEMDKVWMTFAFVGGPLVLDSVMAITLNQALPARTLGTREGDTRFFTASLRFNAMSVRAPVTICISGLRSGSPGRTQALPFRVAKESSLRSTRKLPFRLLGAMAGKTRSLQNGINILPGHRDRRRQRWFLLRR